MVLAFGDFVFDLERNVLRRNGVALKVDPQQLALLSCLVTRAGQLVVREKIVEEVWGGRSVTGSALSVAVAKLRKVLGGEGTHSYIENRYGRGYRFVVPVIKVEASLPAPGYGQDSLAAAAPLFGREELCAQLTKVLESCRFAPGKMCALIGEAGIGKTRVAEVLEQAAHARGIRCAWARYNVAEGAPPLFPFLQALRELNMEGIADDVLASLDTLSQWQASASSLSAAGQLSQDLVHDGRAAMHRLLDQISQSLCRVSQMQPLLVIVDDVHWADTASLRLMSYLVNDLPQMRAFFVLTLRSTDMPASDPRQVEILRLLSSRRCERHELARLAPSDVERFVKSQFSAAGPEVAQAVYARSEGNPFYMVELLRPWLGDDSLSVEQLRYPGLALDSMRKRLAELPAGSRDALCVASVIGHDFDLGLLSRVTGQSADHLLEELDSSLANETIVASPQSSGSFAFAHELIREVLYGELSASERCRMHLQIGQALEERRAAGIAVSSTELAHHFLSALPYGELAYAIGHARAAASASMRMAAHADARVLLLRALDAVKFGQESDPAMLSALWLELALVERVMGHPSYKEHLQQGLKLARQHKLGLLLATAGRLLSPGPGLIARSEAADVLEAALEALLDTDAEQRAIVLTHLAWTPPNSMSQRRVQELLSDAEALTRGRHAPDVQSVLREARLFFLGGPATQHEAEQIAREIERELRTRPELARSARSLALADSRLLMAMQRGDTHAMEHSLEQHKQGLLPLNNVELDWHWERMQLVLRMNRGEFAGVAEELERLRTRAQRLRLQAWHALWARDYGQLLFWTGDPTQLSALLKPSLTLAASDTPIGRSYKLRAMAETGLLAEAENALSSVTEPFLRDLPQDRDYLGVLAQFAVAVVAVGSKPHAAVLYDLLEPYAAHYAASIAFECMGSISYFLGMLAHTLGKVELAFSHLQHAVAYNERAGIAACAIQSQVELSRLLLAEPAVRDQARARSLLAAASLSAQQRQLAPLLRAIETIRRRHDPSFA